MPTQTLKGSSSTREVRHQSGLSQVELAQRVGVSRQTVISIERGDYSPSVFLALRLARVLDCRVEDLFHLDD